MDYSYAHSSAEKTHRRSGSTGSPKAARWASRSLLNKSTSSTADSAIHIMPMTPRAAPVTDGVAVAVETVVDFDKEVKDDYTSARSFASRDDDAL